MIEKLVGHLQFMVRQKNNLIGHLILPQIFPVRQNVWCAFFIWSDNFWFWSDIVQCLIFILRPVLNNDWLLEKFLVKCIKGQNLRDQQVVLVNLPNCPNFCLVFRYYEDLISCETFSKIFLRFQSYDPSKFCQFLGGLLFLSFSQTFGRFF